MKNSILTRKQEIKIKLNYIFHLLKAVKNKNRLDFINLGYNYDVAVPKLSTEDVNHWVNHYHMVKLYVKSFENIPMNTIKTSLEIGCGFGGACYFIKNYYKIETVFGIDKSAFHVWYCKNKFAKHGINFLQGSSSKYKNLKHKFDLIYSVEASNHFKDLGAFFSNSYKFMNDGGSFLYVDMFESKMIPEIEKLMLIHNFKIVTKEMITDGVVAAFTPKTYIKHGFIESYLLNLDGLDSCLDSKLHHKFITGEYEYIKYILKKNDC